VTKYIFTLGDVCAGSARKHCANCTDAQR
jgi:hypothetical protein